MCTSIFSLQIKVHASSIFGSNTLIYIYYFKIDVSIVRGIILYFYHPSYFNSFSIIGIYKRISGLKPNAHIDT